MNLTVSVAFWPGLSVAVFLPPILKSWLILPLFVTVKITVPIGALRFENTNLNSEAATAMRVTLGAACDEPEPTAPVAARTPVASPAVPSAINIKTPRIRRIDSTLLRKSLSGQLYQRGFGRATALYISAT